MCLLNADAYLQKGSKWSKKALLPERSLFGRRWADIAVRHFERNARRHTPSLAHRSVRGQPRGRPLASVDDYGRRLRITIVQGHTGGIFDYDYEQDYDYEIVGKRGTHQWRRSMIGLTRGSARDEYGGFVSSHGI